MKQSDIKILLGILCVAIVGGVYLYVFKPCMEDKEAYDAEISTLQDKYDDLKAKDKDREMYEEQTKENLAKFHEELDKFPATLVQEKSVMFIKGIDKDDEFEVSSTGLGQPAAFFTMNPAPDDELGENYECYSASFPISYEGSYEGIKELVEYVMDYPERMNITSMNISYDAEEDKYSGSISLNAYCITGNGRTDAEVDVNEPIGADNIFLGGEGSLKPSTYKYDSDNGAALKTDNDVEILLVNANNDLTDGIIVGKGDNLLKNADNDVASVEVKVEAGDDDTYKVTYTMGDESFTVDAKDDVKIYVKSSERVDDNDKNGVKLSIKNTTDAPVFVLVDGDDEASPRFNMGGKTGTVKVY